MLYQTHCLKCEHVWEQEHRMAQPHSPCPECKSREVESVIGRSVNLAPPLDSGWESESNGLGRYFPAMEQSIDCKPSRENFFRSRREAIEACKRRGFDIIAT